MGWNTPDDCPWSSDQDYYDSKRGPFEGPDDYAGFLDLDDEDPEYTCEHCNGSCTEPYGTDPITECCNCRNLDAPKVARVKPCSFCAERAEIQKQITSISARSED